MLGPNFSEGQVGDSDNAKTIPLPEDDADALCIIFCIMHGRTENIPDPLDPDMVLRVSCMADKYDCTLCMRYPIKSWMEVDDSITWDQRWKLLAAAYFFRNESGFKKHSNEFITGYNDTYVTFLTSEAFQDSIVVSRVCGKSSHKIQMRKC
jgi:hypothetical protein